MKLVRSFLGLSIKLDLDFLTMNFRVCIVVWWHCCLYFSHRDALPFSELHASYSHNFLEHQLAAFQNSPVVFFPCEFLNLVPLLIDNKLAAACYGECADMSAYRLCKNRLVPVAHIIPTFEATDKATLRMSVCDSLQVFCQPTVVKLGYSCVS